MIDLTSKEEAVKHLQHIQNTFVNFDKPLTIYKDEYKLEMRYLGNTIYMLNTKPLDIKIDDFIKKADDKND